MSDPAVQPVELNLERSKQLSVRWADGHESVIPLSRLRRECPCASCRETRREHESNPLVVSLPVERPQDMVLADSAELVGHYALRIRWKDGHEAGIYDFGLLRRLE